MKSDNSFESVLAQYPQWLHLYWRNYDSELFDCVGMKREASLDEGFHTVFTSSGLTEHACTFSATPCLIFAARHICNRNLLPLDWLVAIFVAALNFTFYICLPNGSGVTPARLRPADLPQGCRLMKFPQIFKPTSPHPLQNRAAQPSSPKAQPIQHPGLCQVST